MNKNKIAGDINNKMPHLKSRYSVKKLGIFGSVVRGEDSEESDVDILVEFNSPVGFFDFVRLERYLSDVLGKNVDLVTKGALKSPIKDSILSDVIYV